MNTASWDAACARIDHLESERDSWKLAAEQASSLAESYREEARKWEWVAHNWPFDDEEECCDCNRCEDGRRDIIIDLLARYQPGGES